MARITTIIVLLLTATPALALGPAGGGGSGGGSGCTTSGSSVLKGNGTGGCSNAVSGTDFAPPTSGSAVLKGNGSGGTASAVAGTDFVAPASVGGDCTFTGPSTFTCTKTNGVAFATSATTDTTNASNITSGTLAAARGGAGTVTGILKANGSGAVSAAASGTDYQAPIAGNTLASHNFATSISTAGTISGAQPACGDLSNGQASCSTDTTNATNISSGTLNNSRLPSSVSVTNLTASSLTSGNCVQASTGGLLTTTGTGCGGGGSGTVSSGTGPAVAQYNSGTGTTVGPATVSGDATIAQGGALTVTKTNGTPFATSATTDTTNASNITSGTLAAARGGAGTLSGILKANGSGTVSAAVSGTDYQAPIAGNTLSAHNFATSINSSGTISGAQPAASDITGLATSATTDTTNASNITSGTLGAGRLPAFSGDLSSSAGSAAPNVVGLHPTLTAITSSTVLTSSDLEYFTISNSSNTATLTVTLPASSAVANRMFFFKRIDSNNGPVEIIVNGTPGTDTIDGQTNGLWLGGGTASNGSYVTAGPSPWAWRGLFSDGAGEWYESSGSPQGVTVFGRCIPSGDVSIPNSNGTISSTTSVCSFSMPCYPYDPHSGTVLLKIDESDLPITYSGGTPQQFLTCLTENASGTPHSDCHGSNYFGTSPFMQPMIGGVYTLSSNTDPYAPWQLWCQEQNNLCTGANTPWACCGSSPPGTAHCPGGVSVSVSMGVNTGATNGTANAGVTLRKGAGVSSNGSDAAMLIEANIVNSVGQ